MGAAVRQPASQLQPERGPHADLAAVLACDVATRGLADLVGALGSVRRVRGVLDSAEAAINTRLSELNEQGRGAAASDVVARNAHISAKEAARRDRRAKALPRTTAFGGVGEGFGDR